jgi:shikimate kinase
MVPIFLVGMHGCGKSFLAEGLARAHKKKFISTDALVEKSLSMPLAEIFKKYGENFYREKEKEIILSMCDKESLNDCIISAGAHSVLSPQLRDLFQNKGKVIYVKATPETVYEHVTGTVYKENNDQDTAQGPRLKVDMNKIRKAYNDHHKFYELCATDIIDIDGLGKVDAFLKVNRIYEKMVCEKVRVMVNIDK